MSPKGLKLSPLSAEHRTKISAAKKGRNHPPDCAHCVAVTQNITHGHRRSRTGKTTPTYFSWDRMRARCMNPNSNRWKYYGGRGVTVCDRWSVFENFLADMGERPAGKTLDRIDVNGNYEPGNCRWATASEQQRNRQKAAR